MLNFKWKAHSHVIYRRYNSITTISLEYELRIKDYSASLYTKLLWIESLYYLPRRVSISRQYCRFVMPLLTNTIRVSKSGFEPQVSTLQISQCVPGTRYADISERNTVILIGFSVWCDASGCKVRYWVFVFISPPPTYGLRKYLFLPQERRRAKLTNGFN